MPLYAEKWLCPSPTLCHGKIIREIFLVLLIRYLTFTVYEAERMLLIKRRKN
jgi:hypothetical protein